jgi:hypothetical protein
MVKVVRDDDKYFDTYEISGACKLSVDHSTKVMEMEISFYTATVLSILVPRE